MRIGLQIQENLTAAFLFLSFMSHFSLLVSSRPVFVKIVENQINGTRTLNTTDSTLILPSENIPIPEEIRPQIYKHDMMLTRTSKPNAKLPSMFISKLMPKASKADALLPNIPKSDETSVEHIPQYINDTSLEMAQAKIVKKSHESETKPEDNNQPEKGPTLAETKHTSEKGSLTNTTHHESSVRHNVSNADLPAEVTNVRTLENNFQFSESDAPICSEAETGVVHQWTSGCCPEKQGIPCACDLAGNLSTTEVSELTDEMVRLKTGTTCLCKDQQQSSREEMCQDGRGFDVFIVLLTDDADASRNSSDLESLGKCLRYEKGNSTDCESIIIIYSATDNEIYTAVGVSASSQGLTEICRANIHKKYQNIPNTETPAVALIKIISEYRAVLGSGKCSLETKIPNDKKDETDDSGLNLYAIIVIALVAMLIAIAAVGYICSAHRKAIMKHRRPSTSQFSPRGSGQAHLYGRQWYTEVTFRRDGPCSYMGIFPRGRGMMYN